MKALRTIVSIIDLKAVIITLLAVASTYLCIRYRVLADFPLALIATAIVFPVVFSIGGAYKRREVALSHYAAIKANGRAVYFAARDWLEKPSEDILVEARTRLGAFMDACRTLFTGDDEHLRENEERVYEEFSSLSRFIKTQLRANGLPSGECSRCNQYLSKMFIAFESIKHIYQYRTPNSLRAFSDFFITILPVLYGPYFAFQAQEYTYAPLAYLTPVLFALILVSLDNIQHHLENPFDGIGEDDVAINVEQFVGRLN
jgi:hypothetical protein